VYGERDLRPVEKRDASDPPLRSRNEPGVAHVIIGVLCQRPHLFASVMLAKKFCERLHRFDVRAENLESGQDWHG
jgi:hypothetical protein